MDAESKKEIQEIKAKILREKEKITDINQLIHKEIDREFQPSVWELSEKELDIYIAENLSVLSQNWDTRPDKKSISSHRKVMGKLIVRIKRILFKMGTAYSNVLLDKQVQFNQKVVELLQGVFLRQAELEKKISKLEKKVRDCEENIVIANDKSTENPQD
jgi:hypothetical protein